MINSRKTAIARANATKTNVLGTCQAVTRGWFNAPAVGDVDKDKDADAVDGWLSEPARYRHPGDRNPPIGVPLAFKGGSKGYGHRAMTVAPGGIRSTDMSNNRFTARVTSTVTAGNMSAAIAIIEKAMGVQYLGWSETISGQLIPDDISPPKEAPVTNEFTVCSVNLMSNPVNKNVDNTLNTTKGCDLIGVQECDLSNFKNKLKAKYPSVMGLGPINNDTYSNPVVAKKATFAHLSHGTTKSFDGASKMSKTKRMTHGKIRHKKTGAVIGFVNLHSVVVKADRKAMRLKKREQAKQAALARVKKFVDQGLPVVITGDFNDKKNWFGSKFEGRAVKRFGQGIDQIILINGKDWKLVKNGHEYIPSTSDHKTLKAKVKLVRK